MGCCQSADLGQETRQKGETSLSEIDGDEPNFVNDDTTDRDHAPLLMSPASKTVHVSASSSSSMVDGDLIQKLLDEVEDFSDD